MTAAPMSANPSTWPPPSPLIVVLLLTFLALNFAARAVASWPRRQREESLRKEIQARPVVTFQARVDVRANFLGTMTSQHGPLYLIVCGDAFEVSHPFPLARFVFGQDYWYRAEDTTIEVVSGPRHGWMEISGQPIGSAARIWIGRRSMNRQIWDALVRIGAHPIGSSPVS